MANTVKEYDVRLDSKKRVTLRGAKSQYYRVLEKGDGTIELSPRVLVHPDELSSNTLKMIDSSVTHFKLGKASEAIDMEYLDKLIK